MRDKLLSETLYSIAVVILNHASGTIIGAFVGDAIGSTLEFLPKITQVQMEIAMTMPGGGFLNVGAGQFTDDSELAMCQLNALRGKNPLNGFPAETLLEWYREWAASNPFDIGNTTVIALARQTDLNIEEHIQRVKKQNSESKSNGSMMRMTPLCVWSRNLSIEARVQAFRADAELTHPNPTVLDACSAYGLAVSSLILSNGDVEKSLEVVNNWADLHCGDEVKDWLNESKMSNLDSFYHTAEIGFVKWGFVLAFFFLRMKISYQDAIEQTLLFGGDTDTNAAIVGGMVGARVGEDNIPSHLSEKMMNFHYVEGAIGHKRPSYLSPNTLREKINQLFEISEI